MTPQDKARELTEKHSNKNIQFSYIDTEDGQCIGSGYMTHESAKQCALICVDEIGLALGMADTAYDLLPHIEYWQKVKEEIEKL